VEAMRDKWTDERLDDLKDHMNEGFGRQQANLRDVRSEVHDLRSDVNALRAEMNTRFEAMQRLILQVGAGMIGTMVIGFVGLVVSQP
jgi:hypothetical protein